MKAKEKLVIVITGGARGLGEYLAKSFLKAGHIVNVIDIFDNKIFNEDYYCADISNYKDVQAIFEKIYLKYKKIDVLINNAAKRYFSCLEGAKLEDITEAIQVNFTANYFTTKEALKYMRANISGRIINISSNSSFKGYAQGSIYCASKAGLNIFTEAISNEIDKNIDITINVICPSSIDLGNRENNKITDAALIQPKIIFKVINKIINSNLNGAVIPVVSFRVHMFNLFCQIKNMLKWTNYFIWKYL